MMMMMMMRTFMYDTRVKKDAFLCVDAVSGVWVGGDTDAVLKVPMSL